MTDNFHLDFLGVGPQKTASSWLNLVLESHPRLALPEGVKETMFFDEQYEKGFAWYKWHFKNAKPEQLLGEIAPSYFDDEQAFDRIAAMWPKLKIIVNVRNPVERAFSLYRHHYSKGRVPQDFEQAAKKIPRIITSGHYAKYCDKWEKGFGKENVLYLLQEDIEQSPQTVLDQVCQHLGVEKTSLPSSGKSRVNEGKVPRSGPLARIAVNVAILLRRQRLYSVVEFGKRVTNGIFYSRAGKKENLSPELYCQLWTKFEGDVHWLEKRLGRRFTAWEPAVACKVGP